MSMCLDKRVEAELRAMPGNNICCDCEAKSPQWASVSFGIFMCLECSGRHRALGVHISFVRSVTMDSWSEKQIQMMRIGGNEKFNKFLASYNIEKSMHIAQKYNTPAALYYREKLNAEANGLPPPSKLPDMNARSSTPSTPTSTEPLPGESEADYIARQRRLQEEARERMRQKFGSSSGLSSSGKMQGIGSDPNYRSGTSTPGGNDAWPAVDVNQIADVSTKAFSYVSSTLSVFGEQVLKSTKQLIDEPVGNANNGNNSTNSNLDSNEDGFANTWSSLTSGAASLWSKATAATTDLLQTITSPEDEDLKFPRPPSDSMLSSSGNSSTHSGKAQAPTAPNRKDELPMNDNSNHRSTKSLSSDNSWDSMSDVLREREEMRRSQQDNNNSMRLTKPGIAEIREEDFNNQLSISGKGKNSPSVRLPKERETIASPVTLSRNSSGMSMDSNLGVNSPTRIGIAEKGSSKNSVKKESPVGDDFFATFGV